ncbi:MAG TPA: hypothetical protein DCP08_02860 [Chloroflexi bacterium]|nr:hypothetical protein [Chloroflexota bacterium]
MVPLIWIVGVGMTGVQVGVGVLVGVAVGVCVGLGVDVGVRVNSSLAQPTMKAKATRSQATLQLMFMGHDLR